MTASSNRLVFGVDPGVTGAVSGFFDRQLGNLWDVPTIGRGKESKKEIDCPSLVDYLRHYAGDHAKDAICFIESVHAMRGKGGRVQGVTSSFNFGMSFGMVRGIFAALGVEVRLVTPQAWKKHFNLIGTAKDDARVLAMQMFPEAALSRKKDTGRADALLIGAYGLHLLTKGKQ
jgi:crossover junction endodeoxyribonuclease RuvC